jgi:uncharacterized membrane protein YciS (DUF1049 family)
MQIANFFKQRWVLQVIVGLGLFICSFAVEYQVMRSFVAPSLFAFFLALSLEAGKVTAIIWHYYMNYLSASAYPGSVRIVSVLFRLGLVVLSVTCSQLFLNSRLDRPNLAHVKKTSIAVAQQRLDDQLARLDSSYAVTKNAMQLRHRAQTADHLKPYDQRIHQLEAMLLKEMDNVVNGIFKGSRYKELERRMENEKAARQTILDRLHKRQSEEVDQLEKQTTVSHQNTQAAFERRLDHIGKDDFSNDDRVNDPQIVAILKVTDSLFGMKFQPMQFVFIFSLLLSLLMEGGIILAFATITVCMAPAIKAQHEINLEQEILKTEVDGVARREKVQHNAAMEKINKSGQRAVEKAKAYVRHQRPTPATER